MTIRKLALALSATAILAQAGTASANGFWTFDEPYWKQPVTAAAADTPVKNDAPKKGAYDFLTDYSPA